MTKDWEKKVAKLDRRARLRIADALVAVRALRLEHLDVKPLVGQPGLWRARVGDLRIVFEKGAEEGVIKKVDFRQSIYKGL